jgi:hypothetical protein
MTRLAAVVILEKLIIKVVAYQMGKGLLSYQLEPISILYNHRLSINRETRRGKEKSPSDLHSFILLALSH